MAPSQAVTLQLVNCALHEHVTALVLGGFWKAALQVVVVVAVMLLCWRGGGCTQ